MEGEDPGDTVGLYICLVPRSRCSHQTHAPKVMNEW